MVASDILSLICVLGLCGISLTDTGDFMFLGDALAVTV